MKCEHEQRALQIAMHATETLRMLIQMYNIYGLTMASRNELPDPKLVDVMERFLDKQTEVIKTHGEYFENQ